MEEVVVFLTYKVFMILNFSIASYKQEIPKYFFFFMTVEKIKHLYLIHTLSNKAFKDKVVNQALLSLHEGQGV